MAVPNLLRLRHFGTDYRQTLTGLTEIYDELVEHDNAIGAFVGARIDLGGSIGSAPMIGPYINADGYLAEQTITRNSTGSGTGTDAGAALNALFEAVPSNIAQGFWFAPPAASGEGYRLSIPMRPKRAHRLLSTGGLAQQGAKFFCDATVGALHFDSPASGGAGSTAGGWHVEGMAFVGGLAESRLNATFYAVGARRRLMGSNGCWYEVTSHTSAGGATPGVSGATEIPTAWTKVVGNTHTDGGCVWTCLAPAHGVTEWSAGKLQNCFFRYFNGHGAYLHGLNSETPSKNCNGWIIDTTMFLENCGYGLFVDGGDAQAGASYTLHCQFNFEGGVRDETDAGNSYDSMLMEFNGHLDYPHQYQFYSFSQNGQPCVKGGYIEGGAWCSGAGNLAVFGVTMTSNYGWETEAAHPPMYGRQIVPFAQVYNHLRSGGKASLAIVNGGGAGTNHSPFDFLIQNPGLAERVALMRGRNGHPEVDGTYLFHNVNVDAYNFGWPGPALGNTGRLIAVQDQLGTSNETSTARRFSNPAFLLNGERMPRGSVYILAGTAFTEGGPAYRINARDGNAYGRWAANTDYVVGNRIVDSNGRIQRCTAAGKSHATTEPAGWSAVYGGTTADGPDTLVWTVGEGTQAYTAGRTWAAGEEFVPPVRDGFIYRVDEATLNADSTPATVTGTPASFSGAFGELQTHDDELLKFRRYRWDTLGARWCNGPNTSGTLI